MESLAEREERIKRLEQRRVERRAIEGTAWPTPDDSGTGSIPVEIAPGRGDLNYSSGFVPTFPSALHMIGRTVSFARLFMSQPWVAAAVMRMLTWSVRVPLKLYRRTGDDYADRVRLLPKDHPLAAALTMPWDRASMAQLTMSQLGPLLVHGNAVTLVEQGAGEAIRFTPKDWRFTMPIMPWRDSVEGFRFDTDTPAFAQDVSIDDVVHLAWWSPTGPIGVSPLQQLGVTLQIEDAAQRYQRALFQNGARPPSAVVASEEFLGLKPEERREIMANLRQDMNDLYSGPENAGKPALLPPGLDWKPVGQTTVEAGLIDQRKITREEIVAVYLIPPPLLGILDRATFSNLETQAQMTYTECLGPPLVLIEQAINSQVIGSHLAEPDLFVEYDFGAVLRGDRLAEIDALRSAIGTALISPNEGRSVLNMPKVDDTNMDAFYLPVNNLRPVGSPPAPPSPIPFQHVPSPDAQGQGATTHPIWLPPSHTREMETVS